MATGYTQWVADGRVTDFKEFVLMCARNFGACYAQRDEDINELPKKQEVDTYYKDKANSYRKKLRLLELTTDEELLKQERKEIEELIKNVKGHAKQSREINERYQKMLNTVHNWNPPTPDHLNLKVFMIDQLKNSIAWNVEEEKYNAEVARLEDNLKNLNAVEIREEKMKNYISFISSYDFSYSLDCKRIEEQNRWIDELYKSLT